MAPALTANVVAVPVSKDSHMTPQCPAQEFHLTPDPSVNALATGKTSNVKDSNIPVELHDGVFHVCQVTRSTALECLVGADMVHVEPNRQSHMHRHNRAETVLFITAGAGEILLDGMDEASCTRVAVVKGDRVTIAAGRYHAVRTLDECLDFLSVQMPPILDKASGILDLEWLVPAPDKGMETLTATS